MAKKIKKATKTPPELAPSPTEAIVKLDLGCGQSPKEGFEGVDIWSGAKHRLNLVRFPWPWADNSIDELYSSHFVEHLPDVMVQEDGMPMNMWDMDPNDPGSLQATDGKDLWFRFFEECHRILRPNGIMTVICPAARHHRGFQDPTHRRFIVAETFAYLSDEFRKINKLDHYNTWVNFGSEVNFGVDQSIAVRHKDYQADRIRHGWNVVADWHAKLYKLPRATKAE